MWFNLYLMWKLHKFTLLSKTVHNSLLIFKLGDLSCQGRCWNLSFILDFYFAWLLWRSYSFTFSFNVYLTVVFSNSKKNCEVTLSSTDKVHEIQSVFHSWVISDLKQHCDNFFKWPHLKKLWPTHWHPLLPSPCCLFMLNIEWYLSQGLHILSNMDILHKNSQATMFRNFSRVNILQCSWVWGSLWTWNGQNYTTYFNMFDFEFEVDIKTALCPI